jgi:hypothetical protein
MVQQVSLGWYFPDFFRNNFRDNVIGRFFICDLFEAPFFLIFCNFVKSKLLINLTWLITLPKLTERMTLHYKLNLTYTFSNETSVMLCYECTAKLGLVSLGWNFKDFLRKTYRDNVIGRFFICDLFEAPFFLIFCNFVKAKLSRLIILFSSILN